MHKCARRLRNSLLGNIISTAPATSLVRDAKKRAAQSFRGIHSDQSSGYPTCLMVEIPALCRTHVGHRTDPYQSHDMSRCAQPVLTLLYPCCSVQLHAGAGAGPIVAVRRAALARAVACGARPVPAALRARAGLPHGHLPGRPVPAVAAAAPGRGVLVRAGLESRSGFWSGSGLGSLNVATPSELDRHGCRRRESCLSMPACRYTQT